MVSHVYCIIATKYLSASNLDVINFEGDCNHYHRTFFFDSWCYYLA